MFCFFKKLNGSFFVFFYVSWCSTSVTNMMGEPFLFDFSKRLCSSFAVTHRGANVCFTNIRKLFHTDDTIFMRKFGIQKVMLIASLHGFKGSDYLE
jgi:hypothetical protein